MIDALPAPSAPARLPVPRGPVSAALLAHLVGRSASPGVAGVVVPSPLDEDAQLALHTCYELAYRGLAGVDDEREWDPVVLELRARLEAALLADLRTHVPRPPSDAPDAVVDWLGELARPGAGPGLSEVVEREATLEQFRELCVHRSAYQLKEADPHTWALPRLAGEAKAAMVEIQADEYGHGRPGAAHAELFAATMGEAGLDATYGAHVDRLPGVTLATDSLISLLGLHRRWRGALVGHLALFEMTSVGPMGRYARAVDRLLGSSRARRFFDVHVEADQHHQVLALRRMVAGLLAAEPGLAADVAFGAGALVELERRFSAHVLGCWAAGRSSLRVPDPQPRRVLRPVVVPLAPAGEGGALPGAGPPSPGLDGCLPGQHGGAPRPSRPPLAPSGRRRSGREAVG